MQKKIIIKNREIYYQVRNKFRSLKLSLSVYANGKLVVTKAKRVSEDLVKKFIQEKSNWILDNLNISDNANFKEKKSEDRKRYLKYKEKSRLFINSKLKEINNFYNFNYKKVSIRDQKTRWGSCSKNGNLNFSYKILFLPDNLANYIIVHELCHLKEFNHSFKFWLLLSEFLPNYKELKKELRTAHKDVLID